MSMRNDNKTAVQFYFPALLIIAVLFIIPMVQLVRMAFSDWYLLSSKPGHPFVGLKNFKDVVSLVHIRKMVVATLTYTLLGVAGKMSVGLGIALLLNREFRGRILVRGLMVVPWAMPTVVACTIFLFSLDPTYGVINWLLVQLHIIKPDFSFFSIPGFALLTLIVISIWKFFPFVCLMLLAELQTISPTYYDAASIDGAGRLSKFRYITWPLLQPVWRVVLILQILWTVKEFELVFLITSGGPDNSTAVIGVDVYLNAFRFYRMGLASAEGIFLLLFSLGFAYYYFVIRQKYSAVI